MTVCTDEPRNIQIFNRVVSIALAELYQAFPNPMDLDPNRIGAAAHSEDDDYEEVFGTVVETAGNALAFLLREGFIAQSQHFGGFDAPGFSSVVLTAKGLHVLGIVPESLEGPAKPLGSRFADAVEGGQWGIAALAVRELVSLAQRK